MLFLLCGFASALAEPAASTPSTIFPPENIYLGYVPWKDINGLAVGNFDSGHPGNEIVAVSDTDAIGIFGHGDSWRSQLLHRDATLILGVAVGDFDPSNPGEEIVVVGQSGKVAEIYGARTIWNVRFLYQDPMDLEHAIVADIDGDGHNEILVGGSSGKLTMITGNGTDWTARVIFTVPTGIAGIATGDFDSNHPGNEIAVIGLRDGKLFEVYGNGSSWSSRLIWTDPESTPLQGLTSVAVGEYNTSFPRAGVVVGNALGYITGIQGSGSSWSATTIYHLNWKVGGVAVGEFDSTHYGEEIVAVDYGLHQVLEIYNSDWGGRRSWVSQVIFIDADAPKTIVLGNISGDSKSEILVGGYSQRVTILREQVVLPPTPTITFWYTLTFYASPGVSSITVDGITYSPDQLPVTFTWMRGSHHTFNCSSTTLAPTPGVRYVFNSWSDGIPLTWREVTVSEDKVFVASYTTQFYLTVSSPFGNPEGEGWYDAGSKAFVSTIESASTGDLYGWMGAQYLFEGWRGGLYTQQPSPLVLMHEPKSMWAVYRLDYTRFAAALVAVLAISTSCFTLALLKLRRMGLLKTPSAKWRTTALKQGVAVVLILAAIYKTLSTVGTPPWIAAGLSILPGLGWIGYRILYAKYSRRSADQ